VNAVVLIQRRLHGLARRRLIIALVAGLACTVFCHPSAEAIIHEYVTVYRRPADEPAIAIGRTADGTSHDKQPHNRHNMPSWRHCPAKITFRWVHAR
jgi:hypothetical protein